MKSIIEFIKKFFNNSTDDTTAPEGYCPNCWGRQEYGGQFREAINNEKIDLNNIDQKRGWIDAYAKKNFQGIKLRENDGSTYCPTCAK